MRGLMGEMNVETATCDQCMYGCTSADGSPVKKPTTFLTNAPELAKRLRVRCKGKGGSCMRPGGGSHAQCRGKTARMAAVYDLKLCRANLVGFRDQLRCDGVYTDGFVGMMDGCCETERVPVYHLSDSSGQVLKVQIEGAETYKDDLAGQALPPEFVKKARKMELEYFGSRLVWEKRPIAEARRVKGKPPITVR